MTLDADQIVKGITAAGFTEEEWTKAMTVLKLQVQLGLKRAEVANMQASFNAKTVELSKRLDTLAQEEADITAALNKLAPVV